jgi:thiol-disulfide isomerase/thioredoxin
MILLEKIEQLEKSIASDTKVTIGIFRAEWCGDCLFIDSFMEKLTEKYDNEINAFNIDIEQFPDLAKKHSVVGIPSFVAFYKGEGVLRLVSRQRKSETEIDGFFQESLTKIK